MIFERRALSCIAAGAALVALATEADAYPHVVKPGETLAQIAERAYGRVEMEQVLVVANALDAGGGVPVVAGMRVEVPALGHRRAIATDTWDSLALELLGDATRGDVLAMVNNDKPWLKPQDGAEIIVPYNLRYVVGAGDSLLTIAYRFLGDRDKAWMLDKFNHLKQEPVRRGEVILVPLSEIALTDAGKAEARAAEELVRGESAGTAREAQRRADAEIPLLLADVRTGKFVDAIGRGSRLLGAGELTRPQIASIYKALTEAYVALDAIGAAETACSAWRDADALAALDPVELSPKILRACTSALGSSAPPSRDGGR